MRSRWLVAGACLLVTGVAGADPPARPAARASHGSTVERDADAYCRYVKAVAASNSDVLLAPSVFASAGYISGADATAGASALPPTQRLIAGGAYSLAGLNRGLAMRAQADAECRRYTTQSTLLAFVERNRDGLSVRSLRAKAKILDEGLARAGEILAAQKAQLAQARLTVEELDGTQIRVDTMRALVAQTHKDLDALAATPPPTTGSIRKTLADRDAAEEETERQDARVRASFGWDVGVRGGYDRLFGVRDTTPLFAMATVTLSLGWFFQGGANADAREARREWVRAEIEGVDDRVEQVAQRLKATRDVEVVRLRDSTALLADLEARFKSVSGLGGEKARTYADYVWFDLVRVQSEHAYLVEHVRELNELLDEGQ